MNSAESCGEEPRPPVLPPEASKVRQCHHSWWRNSKKAREGSQLHWDAVDALRAILDLSTHLHNYPTPLNTSLAKFLVAKEDLYIPRQHITSVEETWPGVLCVT